MKLLQNTIESKKDIKPSHAIPFIASECHKLSQYRKERKIGTLEKEKKLI